VKKKVTFEIPDYVEDIPLFLMAGREMVAMYLEGKVYKKVERCNQCGECCTIYGLEFPSCSNLENNKCKLGMMMPMACCLWEPILNDRGGLMEKCSIRWKEVDV